MRQEADKTPQKDLPEERHFDGHTVFYSMSFTQRLAWLSEAAASIHTLARCNPRAGCNAFFQGSSGIKSP
ncbi:MAG: hypothetical protein ACLFUP_07210 [Desulfobacteraceae bacterium]